MVMTKKTGVIYEFGPFRIDTVERQLTCDNQTVPLQPKVFDTLLVLVENSGQILEKADLLQELWPDTFVEESSLTQNIFQLRKALGESGSKHRMIETIPRRGYRFIADVKKIGEEPTEALTVSSPPPQAVTADAHLNGDSTARIPQREIIADNSFKDSLDSETETATRKESQASKSRWLVLSGVVFAVLILTLGIYLIISFSLTRPTAPFERMQITQLTVSGNALEAAISPDGKYAAYVIDKGGQQSLWVRQTATTSVMQIVEPAKVFYRGITFSPDSNYIYYASYQENSRMGILQRIPVLGSVPIEIIQDIDSPVAFSPDGRQLAFVRYYPKERESSIILAETDGSNQRRLATRREPSAFSIEGPGWSPDGRIIACTARDRDELGNYASIIAINPGDGSEKPLTSQKWNYVGRISWKKDGSSLVAIGWHRESCVLADQIWQVSYPEGKARRVTNDINGYRGITLADNGALVTIRSQRSSQIYTATDTSLRNAEQITSGFGDHFSARLGMSWTPDGKIVYSSNANTNPDLWVMDADGSNLKQLSFDERGDLMPQVTSDGRYIVFVSERKGTANIWRVDADGSNPRQLTEGAGEYTPSLSPDGRWVVYYSTEEGRPGLCKVSIEGGSPIRLSEKHFSGPSVSPDGKLIVCFTFEEETGAMKPALIRFEDGEVVRIFDSHPLPAPNIFHWSSDSRALIYLAVTNGASNVWLQPVEGGAARMLSDFKSDRLYRLALSRDGKRVAFERGNDINDVVLITKFD